MEPSGDTISIRPALRVIIFGATGMVGEGVTHVACDSPDIASILLIVRRPSDIVHPKVTEVIVRDMFDLTPVRDQLRGFDACFFCLGTTSLGKDEATYRRTTYDLTMNAATVLADANPSMTFCYISGAGTDSTGQGRSMWARIKGRTENDLRSVGFRRSLAVRPAFIKPIPGLHRTLPFTAPLGFFYPLLLRLVPRHVGTMEELAKAMIQASVIGCDRDVLEVPDIRSMSVAYDRRHIGS